MTHLGTYMGLLPACESCWHCQSCERRICGETEPMPGEPHLCDQCWVPVDEVCS